MDTKNKALYLLSLKIDDSYTWRRPFGAVFIPILSFVVSGALAYFIDPFLPDAYQLPLFLALMSSFMVTAYLIYSRDGKTSALSWRFTRREWAIGTALIVALFVFTELSEWLLGLPPEPYMKTVLNHESTLTITIIFVAIVIGAPISEEFGVRYFLINAFPFRNSYFWMWIAILATSALFSLAHTQYENITTYLQIFLIGVLMGYIRIVTNSIALPIVLHAQADALGLLMLT